MKSQIYELAALLNAQMPVLFSFIILRRLTVWTFESCYQLFVPKRFRPKCELVGRCLRHARLTYLLSGTGALVYWSYRLSPDDICDEYSSVRVQGICSMLSLSILLTCNDLTASAFALSALKAVAETSSATLLLTPTAIMSVVGRTSFLYYASIFSLASLYAVACHDPKYPDRTHGAGLSLIYMLLYCTVVTGYILCMRVWCVAHHTLARVGKFRVRLRHTHLPSAAETPPKSEEVCEQPTLAHRRPHPTQS